MRDDGLAGVVPADFGHYAVVHPHGVAQRGTYRIIRRPRRRRRRPAALRASQFLAGNATSTKRAGCCGDQAEIRQENLLGDLMVLAGTSPSTSMGFKSSVSPAAAPMWGARRALLGS